MAAPNRKRSRGARSGRSSISAMPTPQPTTRPRAVADRLGGVGAQAVEERCAAVEALDDRPAQRIEQRSRQGRRHQRHGRQDRTRAAGVSTIAGGELHQQHEDEAVDAALERALAPVPDAGLVGRAAGRASHRASRRSAGRSGAQRPASATAAMTGTSTSCSRYGSAAMASPAPKLAICGVRLANTALSSSSAAQPPAAGPAAVHQPAAADDGRSR